jgi:hypothetical protein
VITSFISLSDWLEMDMVRAIAAFFAGPQG